ncbi:MAG: hypothetical protein KDA87_16080, partial [Planctomycetales bacterium]|nr:hypothetical protein [Planctomycetales bacterium]
CAASIWFDRILLVALLLGLGLLLFAKQASGKRWGWITVGCLVGLVLLNQQRFQPWAYQFLLIMLVIHTLPTQRAFLWVRALIISIYLYSAWNKFDYQFTHAIGQRFLETALQLLRIDPTSYTPEARIRMAHIFPLAEGLVGLGLLLPPLRRWAIPIGMMMHAGLIAILGPFGMNHNWGVLLWNVLSMLYLVVVFGGQRLPRESTKVDGVVDRQSQIPRWQRILIGHGNWHVVPPALVVSPALVVPPKGGMSADRTPPRGGTTNQGDVPILHLGTLAVVQLILMLALVLPVFESLGWWDHWPSWGLYSGRSPQVEVLIPADEINRLPQDALPFLSEARANEAYRRIRIAEWSLDAIAAPIYPEERFQLGVALALADAGQMDDVLVFIYHSPDRWTGQRRQEFLQSKNAIQDRAATFRMNAFPRRVTMRGHDMTGHDLTLE